VLPKVAAEPTWEHPVSRSVVATATMARIFFTMNSLSVLR